MFMTMRYDSHWGQDRFSVASDGYAYRRLRDGRLARWPYDGGTEVADYAREVVTADQIGPVYQEVMAAAW